MDTSSSSSGAHLSLGGDDDVVDEDAPATSSVSASLPADVVDEDADLDPSDRLPKNAVRNGDGSVTLTLRFPQAIMSRRDGKISERRFEQLVFHRLNGTDQRAIGAASDEMQGPVSFARSTRLNQAVMNALWDKMDLADINAGGQVLNNFFASGRTTGKRS